MDKVTLLKDATVAKEKINSKMEDLEKIIALDERKKETLIEFDSWRFAVGRLLDDIFTEKSIGKDFLKETKVLLNTFSDTENAARIDMALDRAQKYLKRVSDYIELGE